jgi:hypothetical protein
MTLQGQGTALAILVLILAPVPVVGWALSVLVGRLYPQDTNANTCAMIGAVVGAFFTLAVFLYAMWELSLWVFLGGLTIGGDALS